MKWYWLKCVYTRARDSEIEIPVMRVGKEPSLSCASAAFVGINGSVYRVYGVSFSEMWWLGWYSVISDNMNNDCKV